MTVLVRGRPFTTRVATLAIDPGLPVGVHRFQLVVVDNAGLSSRPDVALVRIAAGLPGPTPVPGRPVRRTRGLP